ncbi:DNA adenine methylase [Leuconostoc suionicum]|uniref:DNA adenine methylase n=1 Tax=Leuconostoc suionicum TaxID=1511761 RepID=UPI0024ADD19A|nr:DNA adenine methylase [Leuconostoc suionicum]MDI6613955.1 DNA adenine methylase [Leuconostoc suionicum]
MNLILDEKKIRKGKPVGLPYVGSKKKISKKIVEIIKQNFGTDNTVYDVFGGGGAITAELIINGLDVVYNDLDKTITDMFNRVLHQDREWIKTLIVSRDEFFRILSKDDKTIDDELKLLVNSFGNNRKSYLYSKDLSDIKYKLAVEILEKEDTLFGYKKTKQYEKSSYKKIDKNDRLQQLQQLQQLENIQELNNYPKTTNEDYRHFSDIKDSILYLDPPYENTETSSYKSKIDYQDFYNWVVEMSKNNIVLLSSYEVSDDRFECVYEFKNARSTLAGGKSGSRCEKLFMVKL